MKEITTGQHGDPAIAYATAHLSKADVLAERVYAAKVTLLGLPRLTAPPNYVAARAICVVLEPDAYLTPSLSEGFIAAVAAAKALVP